MNSENFLFWDIFYILRSAYIQPFNMQQFDYRTAELCQICACLCVSLPMQPSHMNSNGARRALRSAFKRARIGKRGGRHCRVRNGKLNKYSFVTSYRKRKSAVHTYCVAMFIFQFAIKLKFTWVHEMPCHVAFHYRFVSFPVYLSKQALIPVVKVSRH